MSVIYFHTPGGTAKVRGSERALAQQFADHALHFALRLPEGSVRPHPIEKLLTEKARMYLESVTLSELVTLSGEIGEHLVVKESRPLDLWTVGLNTGLVLGSPAMKLLLRVHGTCEIHSFIQGHNRKWLAELISVGLTQRVLSVDAGWPALQELCLQSAFEPMVLSYSVCDQFPNRHMALRGSWQLEPDDQEGERWYSLSTKERWRTAWDGLQRQPGNLEWNPERWDLFRFDDGLDGFELYDHAVSLK